MTIVIMRIALGGWVSATAVAGLTSSVGDGNRNRGD